MSLEKYTIRGIDIGNGHKDVDWPAVKAADVRFCYVKLTEGKTFTAASAASHVEGARSVGIPVGVYHLWKAITSSSVDQVRHFLREMRRLGDLDPPPVLDLEHSETNLLASTEGIARVLDWLMELRNASGLRPLVYCSHRSLNKIQTAKRLKYLMAGLWVADYTRSAAKNGLPRMPSGWEADEWVLWQHTSGGQTPGISYRTDINLFNGGEAEFAAWLESSRLRWRAFKPFP